VRHHDLLGRVGRLRTRRGVVETPVLLPVVNPLKQLVSPQELWGMGFKAIMVNAYLLLKHMRGEVESRGVHEVIGFEGVVMTDSGAYQLLVHGKVDATPEEVVEFQVKAGSDVAVILDVPTGYPASRSAAEATVHETLRRAQALFNLNRGEALWVGPVQGGAWLDLVERCAREMASLPFDLHALGSPTKVMEQYLFDLLVDMLAAAKPHLPLSRPLHLFGAGHPMMFSLAVALGCDLFDSASYALYARQGRYMVEHGTLRAESLKYLPCSCAVCSKLTVEELREMPRVEVERALAKHNLYACLAELKRVKQAIVEGRLWELLEARSRSHPSMGAALRKLRELTPLLEAGTPISKPKGAFFHDASSMQRPEAYRFRRRVEERLSFNRGGLLLLIPPPPSKPYARSKALRRALKELHEALKADLSLVEVCVYATPLGLVPLELDEVYPASQHEAPRGLEVEAEAASASEVASLIDSGGFKAVVYLHLPHLRGLVHDAALKACLERGLSFKAYSPKASPWSPRSLKELASLVKGLLKKAGEA